MAAQRQQGARIAQRTNTPRLGRYRDMAAPTPDGLPSRTEEWVSKFASSPETARQINLSRLRTKANISAFASSPEDARRAAALV